MKRIKNWIDSVKKFAKDNPKEFAFLLAILVFGALLRLYRIDEYMTFLGDEGRDVIVVRRLLVNFDPILVGPGTSIGNMYLGPLYYYMMAPALLLANYSPVGPAVMVALLGVATIWFVWHIGREWFGPRAGLVAAFLFAISPTVIIYSRSSWNPNIMPFFALLTIYSVWRVWMEKKWKWLLVGGVSFAFVLQSHYLGLLLLPVMGLFWLLTTTTSWKKKKEKKKLIKYTIIGTILFSLLMSPLLIFDARHGWRNFGAMHEFFAKRQTTVSARPWTALPDFPEILSKVSSRLAAGRNELAGKWAGYGVLGAFLILLIERYKKLDKKRLAAYLLIAAWLGIAFVGLGVYKQEIYDHYYGFFFAAPFLLFGGLLDDFARWGWEKGRKIGKTVILFLMLSVLALSYFNLVENPLRYEPNRQLERTREISEKMVEEADGEMFNIAVLAERNYEGAYQYFLEKWNAPFVIIDPQRADETITQQLFVVCELPREECEPTSNPKAEIANFGWSKIAEEWRIEGVTIFKLVHNRP